MSKKLYKTIRIATWTIGSLALLIFWLWFDYLRPTSGQIDATKSYGFNPMIWSRGAGDYSMANPRQTMYLSVLKNHLAAGMPAIEVERLLGQPDAHQAKAYYYLLSYDLNDSEYQYLAIQFDNQQKVLMYYRYTSTSALK
ncbi:hypothetical protein [Gayadomonas joobiniege]|uniref:hypothetical protein n=1 Tax=Gayadomonas joobiniege TaxID=1234606 RepID=UPI00036F8E11|nr:hypothetical protein [Gayadomonas joobiniege]